MQEQKRKRKKGILTRVAAAWAALVAHIALFFGGCTLPGAANSTTLAADEYGKLTETIIEQREGGVDRKALEDYIQQSIDTYSGGAEEAPIELVNCKVSGDSVRIQLKYDSYEDYAAFNGIHCFQGTIKKAEESGYDMSGPFYDENGTTAPMDNLRERANEWKVLILEEPIIVKVPDKILYASDNVTITGRLSAQVNTVLSEENAEETFSEYAHVSDRNAYIIYK